MHRLDRQGHPPRDQTGSRCVRAALCGALLALATIGLPAIALDRLGVDRLHGAQWLALLVPGAFGVLAGLLGRRSRQHLFVLGVAIVVVSATVSLAQALGLALVGDPGMLGAVAVANGAAFAVLVPRTLGPGVLLGTTPLCGASGAVIAVAVWRLGLLGANASALAMLLVLAPVAVLFAVPAPVPSRRRRSARSWRRPLGVLVIALAAWGLVSASPAALGHGTPPVVTALFAAGLAGGTLAFAAQWRVGVLAFSAVAACALAIDQPVGPASAVAFSADLGSPPARHWILAQNGATAAVYDRSTQEMQLWRRGALVCGEGPDRPQSPFVATVARSLLHGSDRVLVLGEGLGRLAPALGQAGLSQVEVAPWRAEAGPLRPRLRNVGPVLDPRQHAPPVLGPHRGPAQVLARSWSGSRDAIVLGEPLHRVGARQATARFQRELRRVVGDGVVVQPFALDRVPAAALRELLTAARSVHPHNAVLAVGDCAALVSTVAPPRWPALETFASWGTPARWQAHQAHLGGYADLGRSVLGVLHAVDGTPLAELPRQAGSAGRETTLALLREWLEPPPAVPARSGSLLNWWNVADARRAAADRQLRAAPAGSAARLEAARLAQGFLPTGSPSAPLQAAQGLPGRDQVSLRAPEISSLCAHAIDPLLFHPPPPLFSELPLPKDPVGELEHLAGLPAAERLAEHCGQATSLGTALRVRFASRCARALTEALACGPLTDGQTRALRELADPFVLEEAGRALAGRGALRELLALWRGDLAIPPALGGLQRGSREDRRVLAAALAGRRDRGTLAALADLLEDAAPGVRRIAGDSLFATAGDEVDYDPDWPRSRRFLAAERVRSMHNREP